TFRVEPSSHVRTFAVHRKLEESPAGADDHSCAVRVRRIWRKNRERRIDYIPRSNSSPLRALLLFAVSPAFRTRSWPLIQTHHLILSLNVRNAQQKSGNYDRQAS